VAVALIVGLLLTLLAPHPLQAQGRAVGACADPEPVLDEIITTAMSEHDLPGLTFALAAHGTIAMRKGYGYADVATGTLVDADTTLFPTASVAKPVTWMALMQLVEDGAVDVDAPVARYLPKHITLPNRFDRPITVADLMTHAAGFEDRLVGIASRDQSAWMEPLTYLESRGLPRQVAAPGRYATYCNDCLVLAAALVEHVSGVPFTAYIEQRIFTPLGMHHSRFRHDLPATPPGSLATPYRRRGNVVVPVPPVYIHQPGAGGLVTTAPDMARFALAYLQGGALDGARVLDETTVTRMLGGLFAHDARLPGISYGWFEAKINGADIFYHRGDGANFSALLALAPAQDVGLYLAHSRATGSAGWQILTAFLDACFPGDAGAATLAAPADIPTGRVAGVYQGSRVEYSTIGRLNALNNLRRVAAPEAGAIRIDEEAYVAVSPDLFQNVADPEDLVVFREDAGAMVMLVGERPHMVWQRLAWYQLPVLHGAVIGGAIAVFITSLVAFGVGALRRRRGGRTPSGRATRWVGVGLSGAGLVTVAVFLAWATLTDISAIVFGYPPLLIAAMTAATLAGLLAVAAAGLAGQLWARRIWSAGARVAYTVLALTGLLFTAVLWYWNLIPL
jgi:CubicO group peptidase (beta-lactamase class C family)